MAIDVNKFQLIPENWELVETLSANQTQTGQVYQRIPDQSSNILYDSSNQLLAIFITTIVPSNSNWNSAGSVLQKVSTGLILGGVSNGVIKASRLWLYQWNLLEVSQNVIDYTLVFKIPRWFPVWNCTIYRYIGQVNNELKTDLIQLQTDLNALQNDFNVYTGN